MSNTFTGTWAPDERRVVSVTMNNNGTTTWSPTSPTYALTTIGANPWGWASTAVTGSVAPAANHTFNFVVTAPTAVGGNVFQARMRALGTDQFGQTVSVPVTVDATATPAWGCTLIADDVPATLTPGEKRVVHLTLQNSGTATWPATGMNVESRDTPYTLWSANRNALPAGTVAPGASAVATITITAPSTPNTYAFTRELADFSTGGVGLFRTRTPYCVTKSIVVGGAPVLGATFVSSTLPTTMVADDVAAATVTMNNTGSETWTAGGNYVLYTQNSPANLWGVTSGTLVADTAPGQNGVFNLSIRAPLSAGPYTHRWQVRKLAGAGASPALFGDITNIGVTVSTMGTPSYGSTVVSQTIPTLITAGRSATFSITMQNSGGTPWSGSAFQQYSQNSPVNVWQTIHAPLGAGDTVAVGASHVFNISVVAPAVAGTYTSSWRMRESPGVGFFGATATTANIQVTLCGNSTVNGGEDCDDGNLTNGDGCSNACLWEQTVIDLATATPNRGIRGTTVNGQAVAVTIGDITGDGVPEILASQAPSPAGVTPGRGASGAVYGFAGGAAFFTDTITSIASTDMTTGSGFRISGANANDFLGLVAGGRIVVGDVTDDAISDVIVSAPNADGAGEMRSNSGEVYVLTGGPALMTAGLIDLGAMTMPAQVTAHIYGKAANDTLQVLTVGDITGDSVNDLILGAPGESTNGASAGALYIVVGPVTGDIDLNAPPANVYTMFGASAGDKLGSHAVAIGNLGGSASADMLVGVPWAQPGGQLRRGLAYAFFGPITADRAAGSADVTWLGNGPTFGMGTNVAIGNVTGTSANEAVITAVQLLNGGTQFGGATIWSNVAAGTYDMSMGATPTSVIYGEDANDDCGTALALARINADTYDDIVLGCGAGDGPTNAASNFGEVHVVVGASSLPASYDFNFRPARISIYGAQTLDIFGRYLQGLSVVDIDGDMKADICAGAIFAGGSGPPSKPGIIYCFRSAL